MPWRKVTLGGLAVCAAAITGGCSDSALVNRVADQAATIATLQVELQTCREAKEAASRDLDGARGELAAEKSELAAAKDARDHAQKKLMESDALRRDVASELDTVRTQLKASVKELTLAQAQLREIRTEEQSRLAVIGEWRLVQGGNVEQRTSIFVFNEDGTGVYRFELKKYGNLEAPDICQFRYRKSRELGHYELRSSRPGFADGSFAVDPDGKTSYLSGWDSKTRVGTVEYVLRGERQLTRTDANRAK